MSRFTQIDVRLVAFYGQGGLKAAFPKLFEFLKNYRYELVLEKEPSPYDLVEVIVWVRKDPHIPEFAKKPIVEKVDDFVRARGEARELLLSRRLNELDKVLYRLEDLFVDLESKLT